MTTTVFFVRHGSHDRLDHILCGRMDGVELSGAGRRESAMVAERLSRETVSALYVSPLLRARQTAEPIARALGLQPVVAEDLNEIDLGEWTGLRFDDLRPRAAWRRWNSARAHHRPPGGESMLEIQLRVARWLSEVVGRHPHTGVAAVCHSDVIKVAACHALGLSLDHHDRMEISPASISVLAAGRWGLKVHALNETVDDRAAAN
ncbi:MAG: phosphoglycerate mutase [Caulobacteraceae bacterium]|jgi:broad specificity phosphatase PhoE|nr:phosphoglycerate mutase [Caulobacteraceae bacterium]